MLRRRPVVEEDRSTVGGLNLLWMALGYGRDFFGGETQHHRRLGLSERVVDNEHPETTDKQIFLGVPSSKREDVRLFKGSDPIQPASTYSYLSSCPFPRPFDRYFP